MTFRTMISGNLAKAAALVLLAASVSLAGAATTGSSNTSQKTSHRSVHHKSKKARRARVPGQKAIDGDRAREIQQALIREHYLKGQPTGKWDDATQSAMKRYQADQGWQSKTVPDSRALIRLGLGPDTGRLLNPESAMTTAPVAPPAGSSSAAKTSSGSSSKSTSSASASPQPSSSRSVSMPSASPMSGASTPVSTSSSSASSPLSADPAR